MSQPAWRIWAPQTVALRQRLSLIGNHQKKLPIHAAFGMLPGIIILPMDLIAHIGIGEYLKKWPKHNFIIPYASNDIYITSKDLLCLRRGRANFAGAKVFNTIASETYNHKHSPCRVKYKIAHTWGSNFKNSIQNMNYRDMPPQFSWGAIYPNPIIG
ncbi:hypothetical protein [Parachitinimonas caeni]|uniref:Uncharacterized protein n=1 Tax=Parachitinimonas caeni TaxID=3031301 RepID=A0ABT7DZH3_9NEIS|nr:hypothetical protein [Parachitinimonas caeni]MDK2125465.1 hypothetical protein [Parachitinimonas caeni]